MSGKLKLLTDGGPAFPVHPDVMAGPEGQVISITAYTKIETGMTLRQWYVGLALQGLLAGIGPDAYDGRSKQLAKLACEHADQLLVEESGGPYE